MRKDQWYFVCNREEMVAIACLQLPNEWRDIPNMWEKSDEELATIYEAGPSAVQFQILTETAARSAGYQADSIDNAMMEAYEVAKEWVRAMRAPVLLATDMVVGNDRWPSLDVVARRNITDFRTALRNITNTDVFNLRWPSIPRELNFIRDTVNLDKIDRVDVNFVKMILEQPAPLTIEQIKIDMWLRIHEEREMRKAGGVRVIYDDKPYWFWTDEPTRNQYSLFSDYIKRNNIGGDTVFRNWKTMSKEFLELTPNMFYKMLDTGILAESALFDIAEAHNAAMLASDDPANYDYKTGWPPTFAEALAKGTL